MYSFSFSHLIPGFHYIVSNVTPILKRNLSLIIRILTT